jgi:hypothetical protein
MWTCYEPSKTLKIVTNDKNGINYIVTSSSYICTKLVILNQFFCLLA